MTASHSASVMLASMRSRRMPALLTSDVEAAEGVDGRLDEALGAVPVADVVAVGDGLAAHGLDLVDDLLRRALVGALAVHRAAEVVDDDLGAVVGQQQRVLAADAAAGAGDDARRVPRTAWSCLALPLCRAPSVRPPSSSAPAERGEFRTRAAAWEAGDPMDDLHAETSADAPRCADGADDAAAAGAPRGRPPDVEHRRASPRPRRRRWLLPRSSLPVVLVVRAGHRVGGRHAAPAGVPRNVRAGRGRRSAA